MPVFKKHSLTKNLKKIVISNTFRSSSVVEQLAVNQLATGSNPVSGAIKIFTPKWGFLFFYKSGVFLEKNNLKTPRINQFPYCVNHLKTNFRI